MAYYVPRENHTVDCPYMELVDILQDNYISGFLTRTEAILLDCRLYELAPEWNDEIAAKCMALLTDDRYLDDRFSYVWSYMPIPIGRRNNWVSAMDYDHAFFMGTLAVSSPDMIFGSPARSRFTPRGEDYIAVLLR